MIAMGEFNISKHKMLLCFCFYLNGKHDSPRLLAARRHFEAYDLHVTRAWMVHVPSAVFLLLSRLCDVIILGGR